MSIKTWIFYLCFSVQGALCVKYKSEYMWDTDFSQLSNCFRKEKVSGSGEQGGIPLHFQRALRESSEEAGIVNNA